MFKAILRFADGEEIEDDDVLFETEEEAEEYGLEMLSAYSTGVEVLSMSNVENSPVVDEAEILVIEV